jgi:hypothetical protein
MLVQNWTDILVVSLQQLWFGFVKFLPTVLGAIVVFIIGLVVAAGLGTLVERVIGLLRIDTLLAKAGVETFFKRAGVELNVGRFLGRLVYWFIVIAFFLAAADILQFNALSAFLRSVVFYIPQVVVAVLIMLATFIVANFLRGLVKASAMSAKIHAAKFLGSLTWWAVVIFGVLATLSQLGIAVAIINILVTGFIAMLAIAAGLAFGLGGKEHAARLLDKIGDELRGR